MMEPAAATGTLWTQNHTSQVKSFASRMVHASSGGAALPLVATGSEYTSDQDVSALHARTGELFWSSTEMGEWTYGVALQPLLPADASRPTVGLVAFGCPFFASGIPPPCVLGFWEDATKGNLTWKAPLEGATLGAAHGPPETTGRRRQVAPGRSPSRAFPPWGKAGTVEHRSVGCKFVERNLKISLTATVTSGGRRARRDTNRAAHVVARHRRHGPVPRGRSSTPRALPSRIGGVSLLFGGDSRRLSKSHRAFRGRCPRAERGASPW